MMSHWLTCPPCFSSEGSYKLQQTFEVPEVSVHSASQPPVQLWTKNTNHSTNAHTRRTVRAFVTCVWDPQADLLRASERLGHAAVASAVAGGDEVGDPAALQEGRRGDGALAEEFGKGHHLHEPQSDHGRFSVITKPQTITKTSAHRHDVLSRELFVHHSFNNNNNQQQTNQPTNQPTNQRVCLPSALHTAPLYRSLSPLWYESLESAEVL